MLGFLYALALKLLYPTSIVVVLLCGALAVNGRRPRVSRRLLWLAVATIMICGNGWLVGGLTKNLERWHPAPSPLPAADVILILSGGIWMKEPPRQTVEIGEAGDRLLYGAHLYRQQKAPTIICTGGVSTGGVAVRPVSEEMSELLRNLGIPAEAVISETGSSDTHEHAQNLAAVFQKRGDKRVLLVTSAMHMPRSLGVFRRQCPTIEFIPAPTDFRVTDGAPIAWYRRLAGVLPTPSQLQAFCEVMHEYLGIAYYRTRGWL